MCEIHYLDLKVHKILYSTRAGILLLMICAIFISNIIILKITARHHTNVTGSVFPSSSAMLTTSCVCCAYLSAYAPAIVGIVLYVTGTISLQHWYSTFVWYMLTLTSLANPMIYSITNGKFRSVTSQFFGLTVTVIPTDPYALQPESVRPFLDRTFGGLSVVQGTDMDNVNQSPHSDVSPDKSPHSDVSPDKSPHSDVLRESRCADFKSRSTEHNV